MTDPKVRVGDADREQTVAELERYAAGGYLSLDEFSDRSAAAYRATTRGELAALTEDLAPRADHDRQVAYRPRWRSWSPLVVAAAVLVGVVVLAAIAMVVMMLAMMGGMGMG